MSNQTALLTQRDIFFFSSRRRHTRLTCDWSSDVCSSDLDSRARRANSRPTKGGATLRRSLSLLVASIAAMSVAQQHLTLADSIRLARQNSPVLQAEIGRASCRERVEISVVAVSLKKKRGW